MGRIKYRRMLPVYLSNMQALEERDPNIRQFFYRWQFFCSDKSYSGNCKRCGPCRCAGNKKLVENTRWFNRYHKTRNQQEQFFSNIAYGSEIEKELREISHSEKKETKIHPALKQNKINIQS